MHNVLTTRAIGNRQVGAIGLGAMPMSVAGHMPDETQSIRTILAALDAGVTLIDSADAYTPSHDDVGHNERLVARALALWAGDADTVLVATKGGHTRTPSGWDIDGRPSYLKQACDRYEETMGALKDLHDAGKIQMAGISNANPAQIRLAHDILGNRLVSVQNEYSPRFRTSEPEIDVCAELGLAFLPWSPLGGIGRTGELSERNAAFTEIAEARGVSPQQVCLAWELARSPVVIPIPGASRPETILDSVAAVGLELSEEELARLG
jgi:aryl-alcohol dehydrogenase-like predicted oxidoreductase